jgi:hypothetical protein
MSFDVFISYAHQDKPIATAACAIVEKAGIRCWIAPRDIAPGAEYATALIEALESCKALVLIFSGRANESPHIRREVERAVSRGIPLIPVRIENIEPNAALKFFVSSVHWLDALTPPLEHHFEQLARTLRAILDKEGQNAGKQPGPDRRDETAPIDQLRNGVRNQVVRRARWSAIVGFCLGGVLALLAVVTRDTPDLLLCVGVMALYYGLVYRNIPGDLATAKLVAIFVLGVGFYFLLVNLMASLWVYFVIESVDAVVGIYTLCQLIVLQKLESHNSIKFPGG